MYITYIPHEMLNFNEHQLYILLKLDYFSKFGANFIINNKDKNAVLRYYIFSCSS